MSAHGSAPGPAALPPACVGGEGEPCAKTVWFWRVSKVGQPGAEVPDLPCLTDPAGIGVIGSSSISDPVSYLHSGERRNGADEAVKELRFHARFQRGSRNTPHPLRRTVDAASSRGWNATPGGVIRRCHPGGS